ncbi:hypothetical protein [Streptomyces sp. NPDC049879]|uniref:hypothetical protein n=1 Tax=Streptomyces sp. NPDC049879 TaxID=3365598 RepID=UPI0037B4B50C
MAVNLVKPDPGGDDEDLADVVELVAVDGLVDDEGVAAEQPSRPRALVAQLLESLERHADTPRAPGRSMTLPDLSAYHAFDRRGLVAVRTGSVILLRGTWTLTRRGWVLVVTGVRKARGKGSKSATKPSSGGDTEGAAKAKGRGGKSAPAKGTGGKSAPAKKSKGGKKAPAKSEIGTGNLIVGGGLLVGLGAMFVVKNVVPAVGGAATAVGDWVADHPVDLIRGGAGFLIVFVVVAWFVGAVAMSGEDHETEDHDGGADEETAEAESPGDHEEGQGSGEVEAEKAGGEVAHPSPEEVAAAERIKVYDWVRGSIKTRGNGTAVHLRELALDTLPEGGDMRSEIGRVRALLAAHQITVRDGVKAPASDVDGATRNRPGVHRSDLPQSFTPLPSQGSNLVHLLPVGQPSDLQ